MKCANCDKDALYVYQITAEVFHPYCGKDLPAFLEPRRRAGNLKTTDAFLRDKETALSVLSPIVEAPLPTEEEPKKKPVKKKAK